MPKDNVTSIKSNVLSLESVKETLTNWRSSKKRSNEGIPVFIWKQIFALLGKHTETEIRSVLNLTMTQLERGSALIEKAEQTNQNEGANLVFCEVDVGDQMAYPLDSKPAQAFVTNTCVVELYRPDGMLMKIHICTDRFTELLDAFYKGAK